MKNRFVLLSCFLWLVGILTACGGSPSPTMPGMDMGASPTPSSPSATAPSGSNMTVVEVTETDFHITSSVTTFLPGRSYHFVVTNAGKAAHEFMIMPRSEGSMEGMPMGNMDSMALASISNLGPGETKTLDYTFSSAATGSHPEFACYLPGHYEAGMKLGVTVKA